MEETAYLISGWNENFNGVTLVAVFSEEDDAIESLEKQGFTHDEVRDLWISELKDAEYSINPLPLNHIPWERM